MPDSPDQISGLESYKLMAALSYLGVLVLVPLFAERENDFVTWHAKQGLVIVLGEVVAIFAGYWSGLAGSVLFLLLLLASVIGLMQALLGRRWQAPLIGALAEKFKL